MPKLRHIPTGDIYEFSSLLMARGDMEMVDEPKPEPEPVVEEPTVAPESEVELHDLFGEA